MFACDHCNYKVTTKRMMIFHHSSLHMDIKYNCDTCGYQVSQKGQLTKYRQSVHHLSVHLSLEEQQKTELLKSLETRKVLIPEKQNYCNKKVNNKSFT